VNVPTKIWYSVAVSPTPEACEAIEYGLMEAGAGGTETNDVAANAIVRGYFDAEPDIETIRAALFEALRIYSLPNSFITDLAVTEVQNRDWLAEWKASWQPVEIGRFIVAPPWSEVNEDRLVIRIEPGMAFGTGTHETTRLCLKAIQKHFHGGNFLDVGTGTGILAIAAAKMFPNARIEAVDIDADAVAIAEENARLNGVRSQIAFRVGSINEGSSSADLVCANLTAPVIVELMPALRGATCGRLVLSGILDSQLALVRSSMLALGVDNFEVEQDGEWIALVV
jgi:ribosomal protein L11 methyltransferase